MKHAFEICLFAWLALASSSVCLGQEERRALVVGINGAEPGTAPFYYSRTDAWRLTAALANINYTVSQFTSEAGDQEARHADVVGALKSLVKRSKPEDVLLFYFCGHAARNNGKNYLLFTDSKLQALDETALSLNELAQTVQTCKARRRAIVLDIARNSIRSHGKLDFDDGKLSPEFAAEIARFALHPQDPAIENTVIFACSPGQRARESDTLRGGLLASLFVKALQPDGINKEPVIAGSVLKEFAGFPSGELGDIPEKQTPVIYGSMQLQLRGKGERIYPFLPGIMPPFTENGIYPARMKLNPVDGAEMLFIPPGEFLMGDNDDAIRDLVVNIKNNPRHKVTLKGYYIYKNLVTVRQYEKYCRAVGIPMPPFPEFNENWELKDHPMVEINWLQARDYCKWAGGQLPTEAQWEKAARGTNGRMYPWGAYYDERQLWHYASHPREEAGTTAVGRYAVSVYGLTDMAGNVWQWCQDRYDINLGYRNGPINVDPLNITAGWPLYRVMRGGSWYYNDKNLFRTAFRYPGVLDHPDYDAGFRCVCPVD